MCYTQDQECSQRLLGAKSHQTCAQICATRRTKSVIKGIPVLDRIGNVLKHVLLLTEDNHKNTERTLPGEPEASASHKEEDEGELVKAFMTTDTSVADVPITETSPGFQVGFSCLKFSSSFYTAPAPSR